MSIITNAVVVKDKNGKSCLFGEVVEDPRFVTKHHILTTPLVKLDIENLEGRTENGTYYKIEKLYSTEEYIKFIKETCSEDYASYLLSFLDSSN